MRDLNHKAMFGWAPTRPLLVGLVMLMSLSHSSGAWSGERVVGTKSVGSYREDFAPYTGEERRIYWVLLADGAMNGVVSVGGVCRQPFTVGEIAAYLQYTAKDTQSVARALTEFWVGRQCSVPGVCPAEREMELYNAGHTKGFSEGMASGARMAGEFLLTIRTSEDDALLELLVEKAQSPDATDIDKASGVVAGARLLELRRDGPAPAGRHPAPQ